MKPSHYHFKRRSAKTGLRDCTFIAALFINVGILAYGVCAAAKAVNSGSISIIVMCLLSLFILRIIGKKIIK